MTTSEQDSEVGRLVREWSDARRSLGCVRAKANRLLPHWRKMLALLERVAATEGDRRLGSGLSANDYDVAEVAAIIDKAITLEAKIADRERRLKDKGVAVKQP